MTKIIQGNINIRELEHRIKKPENYKWYSDVHSGVVLSFKYMKELMASLEVGYTIDYVHLVFKDIKWLK